MLHTGFLLGRYFFNHFLALLGLFFRVPVFFTWGGVGFYGTFSLFLDPCGVVFGLGRATYSSVIYKPRPPVGVK
jgi:hypothetical protein